MLTTFLSPQTTKVDESIRIHFSQINGQRTMKYLRFALIALAISATSCASVATETLDAPPKLNALERPSYLTCLKQARGRLEQGPCIENELQWQKTQLNLIYQKLLAQLNAQQRADLSASQAAWEAFMTAETAFAVSFYDTQGGSSDFSVDTNAIKWTVQRRQQLQQHLDF